MTVSNNSRPTKPDELRAARLARHPGGEYVPACDGITAAVVASNGKDPCAYGYRGRSMKPAFRYRFSSAERRDDYVADWLRGANAAIEERAKHRAEMRARHTLAVGDVLYTSWGYEQTNVDFFEVVAVRGAAVDLVKIKQDRTETFSMQGSCVARKGEHVGDVIRGKRPSGQNTVRISSCETARPWDGRPLQWSSYA